METVDDFLIFPNDPGLSPRVGIRLLNGRLGLSGLPGVCGRQQNPSQNQRKSCKFCFHPLIPPKQSGLFGCVDYITSAKPRQFFQRFALRKGEKYGKLLRKRARKGAKHKMDHEGDRRQWPT